MEEDDAETISITLLDEEGCQRYLLSLFRVLNLRPNIRRITHALTVVTSLVVHHGEILTPGQLNTLGHVVDECEEHLVLRFRRHDVTLPRHMIALFNVLFHEAQSAHAEAEDAILRERYRQHGLHGMYRRASTSSSPTAASLDEGGPVCAVCMDRPPACNVSEQCAHEASVCPTCAALIEACPICRL